MFKISCLNISATFGSLPFSEVWTFEERYHRNTVFGPETASSPQLCW